MKKSKLSLVGATLTSKIQSVVGWCSVVVGAVGIIVTLTESFEAYGFAFAVFCVIVGLFLILLAYRTNKLMAKFRLYVCILSSQSSMSIFDLSQTLGKQEKEVMDDVQAMIDRRFFAAAYIDHKKKCLIFPLMEKEAQKAKEDEANLQHVIVSCSVCGGDNKIVSGKTGNCIFCHNFIQG